MQIGILSAPYWQVAFAILSITILVKGILSFSEALSKNNRANGNGKNALPKGLDRLSRNSSELDALRIGESLCGAIGSVITFLFLWDLSVLAGPFPDILSKITLAIGLAGLTTLLLHVSTVSFPMLLALKFSPQAWGKVFWIPLVLSWLTWPVRLMVKLNSELICKLFRLMVKKF